MSIGSPFARASDAPSAWLPSCCRLLTACWSADPKSAPAGCPEPALPPVAPGIDGLSGEMPPVIDEIGIYGDSPAALLRATQVDRPLSHLLDRVEHGHVGLIRSAGREHVGHFCRSVDIRIGDHARRGIGVRIGRVVDLLASRLILDDPRHLQSGAGRAGTLI